MTVIRAVVFDIGGVLFKPGSEAEFYSRWARQIGIAPGRLKDLLWHGPDIEAANIGAITAEEYFRRCAARLGSEEDLVGAIIEDAFSGDCLNQELATYVGDLRPRLRVGALSNTWSFGRMLIERRGITKLFDLIVLSAEVGVKKPDRRIYEILLNRLGTLPDETVFIDDNPENVATALDLGIRGIQFHSTAQVIGALDVVLSRPG